MYMYDECGDTLVDKIFGYVVILVVILCIIAIGYSCYLGNKDHKEKLEQQKLEFAKQNTFFDGQHKIYNLSSKSGQNGNMSGNMSGNIFGISGNINGSISENENIRFTWINSNSGELIPTVLPSNKVKLILSDEIDEPYVTFSWWNTSHYYTFDYEWIEQICNAKIYINRKHIDSNMYIKFGSN